MVLRNIVFSESELINLCKYHIGLSSINRPESESKRSLIVSNSSAGFLAMAISDSLMKFENPGTVAFLIKMNNQDLNLVKGRIMKKRILNYWGAISNKNH